MTQDSIIQIVDPTIGIVELAGLILCNGVDSQIPAQKILFQCDIGCSVTGKTGVTFALFALNARQSVLFFGLWM
jgi:hypothetical protein